MSTNNTPVPFKQRSVVVVVSNVDGDPDSLIVTPPRGAPELVRRGASSFERLAGIVNDPLQPQHTATPGGFDMGNLIRGVGRALEQLGADEDKKTG